VELRDGRTMSAIEIQRAYLAVAKMEAITGSPDTIWLLHEWEQVLNDLEADVERCRDRVDWVAKKFLLGTLQEAEGLEWSDPWLQAIDLEYHNVSTEHGLFHELVRSGQMRRIVSEENVRHAISHPPESTRAFFRGRSVARFGAHISSLQWDEITFGSGHDTRVVPLPHPAFSPELERLHAIIREARDFPEFTARLVQPLSQSAPNLRQ
jgi:hypothetical protein